MMFVRGINNLTFIEKIPEKCEDTMIGIVWSEMRSKDDTLSIWRIENREDFDDAALSIVLPKNKIDKASFLIIEDSVIAENNIEVRKDLLDKNFILNSKAEHYNMINIRACSAVERTLNQSIRFVIQDLDTFIDFIDNLDKSIDKIVAKSRFVVGEIS